MPKGPARLWNILNFLKVPSYEVKSSASPAFYPKNPPIGDDPNIRPIGY